MGSPNANQVVRLVTEGITKREKGRENILKQMDDFGKTERANHIDPNQLKQAQTPFKPVLIQTPKQSRSDQQVQTSTRTKAESEVHLIKITTPAKIQSEGMYRKRYRKKRTFFLEFSKD